MFLRLAGLPRKFKIAIMLFGDVILLPCALWSSVALRMGTWSPDVSEYGWIFFLIPVFTIPIFYRMGLYRAVIRHLNDRVLHTVFYGVTISVLVLAAVVAMARISTLPRSSMAIYWILAVAYIGASRFFARGLLRSLERFSDRREPVAIYGAGRAGLQTALALLSGNEFQPVAFFDDNPELHGTNVAGIRVYNPDDSVSVIAGKGCKQLLIAMPSISRARRREIVDKFESHAITLKTLPGMGQLVNGRVRVEDIREVGIEDLLGRDPVPPIESLIESCISGKSVLVTGAGGSIGSELCRQIITRAPSRVILFEQSEYALYKIEQDLKKIFHTVPVVPILGNILDMENLAEIICRYQVQTIYHAAAYKHVPLVEQNAVAGVQNNILGTLSASRAAIRGKVETFVLISTDKAVRPTSLMGASKRFAELILQGYAQDPSHYTRFCMVRFGNVLGSSGSVVPLFREQIRNDGPVTVTHPQVTRYFMTIPEAAQLVLQAGAMGKGGDVFVLDMGESVRIVDLARKMIELSGFTVRDPITGEGDIVIQFTGLRPGEKLYEELLIGNDVSPTVHPRIMTARESYIELGKMLEHLDDLKLKCASSDQDGIINLIKEIIPEYRPN